MIIGTGIDIIEVDRIGEKVANSAGFREKIFSPEEIRYCESTAHTSQHYAARFAAKEAFLKAIGKGMTISHDLFEIEVCQDESGKPSLRLHGNFRELARQNRWNKIHVSISHVQTMACAVVIVEI